jgi:hypothetical protein
MITETSSLPFSRGLRTAHLGQVSPVDQGENVLLAEFNRAVPLVSSPAKHMGPFDISTSSLASPGIQ